MRSELRMKGTERRENRPSRQLEIVDSEHLWKFSRTFNLPNIRVASIPALLASAEASSIESALLQKLKGGAESSLTRCNHDSFPNGDIPQDRPHISFHLGVNSGAELVDEQVRRVSCQQRKFLNTSHEHGSIKRTYHGDSERKLPLISSRQLTSEPIRVFSQSGSPQQDVHIVIKLWSTWDTLQPPVQQQMFADGQLSVNCCELRANTQRESRATRVLNNRDPIDKDVTVRRRNIPSW